MTEEYIKYVLSAHGKDDRSDADILEGGKIAFYVKEGEIFKSSNRYQTWVCQNRTIPAEIIEENNNYPASMYFEYDQHNKWASGLVECATKNVIYNLNYYKQGIKLKKLINDILKPYHERIHPGKKFELHILTCRVCSTSYTKPRVVSVTRARIPRDRSDYIKPKNNPELLIPLDGTEPEDATTSVTLIETFDNINYVDDIKQVDDIDYINNLKKKYLKYKAKYLKLKKLYQEL
jgi:hypothetical protein